MLSGKSYRVFILALILSLTAATAGAEVPREMIERLAQINVEKAELSHLKSIGKITDEEYNRRTFALDNEALAFWAWSPNKPVMSIEERNNASATVDGLTKAQLVLLEPRWKKELQMFRTAAQARQKQMEIKTRQAVEEDARRAVELERRRLLLERQLQRGEISRDSFTAKEREALAGIAGLRKKYVDAGGSWSTRFDQRLTELTKALADNPDTVLPYQRREHPPLRESRKPSPGQSRVAVSSPQPEEPSLILVTFVLLLFVGGLGLVVWFFWWLLTQKQAPTPDFAPPLTDNYGSATWAAHSPTPAGPLLIGRGVFFGKSSRPELHPDTPGGPIISHPESHTLIVARTRAGKGTRVIVPTLLRYAGSILVIDPKGENAAITARTRRDQLGHAVHIVNPWGEMGELYSKLGFSPATFNPLDAIDRNDPNAVAVAQSLAATICPVTNEKDRFWQGSAANVLTGVFLWISDNPTEQKTLARARQLVTQSRAEFKKVIAQMVTATAFHGAIGEMVSQYVDLADETYSGIMANLAENTKFISDIQIKNSTSSSSFSMDTLRDTLKTVYLIIPHDRIQTHSTWLRLVIASAMQALKRRNRVHAPPQHRCMFLIDEFGSIGHIADVPRDIALMSGYGLDFTLIVQGLDQLKHHYGEAKGTILSNCGYKWFCYVNELETAKYLSESLGKATVRTTGKSKSSGTTGTGQDARSTEGESTTYGEMGRPLLTPDEILNLGREVAILLNPVTAPCYLRTVDYWNLQKAFDHLKDTHPAFYWSPPLGYDPNPYWRRGGQSKPPPRPGPMTQKQAQEILGVSPGATPDEIRAAYTRLMKRVHPDVGGSNYFAAQLNAAKALLLGE